MQTFWVLVMEQYMAIFLAGTDKGKFALEI